MARNKINKETNTLTDNEDNLPIPRVLPSNVQAEQMLLGAILTNNELLSYVSEFLRLEHFFEPIHQKIYNAIEKITEKGLIATPVTLRSMLTQDELFKEMEETEYLAKLITMSMMVINPVDYGKIIYDLAIKRNLINIGEEVVNDAYNSSLEFEAREQIEHAEAKLYDLASEGLNEKSFTRIGISISESLASINRAMKNNDHVIGISTGLLDLDNKLFGFHNSDLVILAGRPSMGKTAFAINLALNACNNMRLKNIRDNQEIQSVGFFSLEMSSEQLTTRLLSMCAEIDSTSLRTGILGEEKYNRLRKEANTLSELQFFIDDTPALSISAIRTRARRMKRKHNLGILFIDYLQLIRGASKSENRVSEISEITQGLKAIAKELNIPVIALSQLSRAVELREDKKPMLSDLRESGTIEQDADIVMFIYREEYYLTRKEPAAGDVKHAEWLDKLNKVYNIADIIVAKHRNGPVGNVPLYYDSQYSKFGNLEKRTFNSV
ncbi:MAG TPA: replicative DNA helicase [Rickettsia endosymbiont of Omalisus fontisbellaquei]|jgi:replicative DNA helicase|nr:replicative DNA helicase [Rickettsia endosymbiont of Omalisus fontisbellaquei]